jgi:hypothetical protein
VFGVAVFFGFALGSVAGGFLVWLLCLFVWARAAQRPSAVVLSFFALFGASIAFPF